MAIRTIGHNRRGPYSTWYDADNDSNETLYFDCCYPLRKFTLSYPIYGSVRAYYYKYNDDFGSEDAYPVIYADNNGVPGEKLSYSEVLAHTGFGSGDTEGWVSSTLKIKRTIYSGEKIWFGFYGVFLCPRYDTGTEYIRTADYDSETPPNTVSYFSSRSWMPKMNLSMYFTYSDSPPSVAYKRNLAEIIGLSENVTRRFGFRRAFAEITNGFEILKQSNNFFRQSTSNISITDTHNLSKGFGVWLQEVLHVEDVQKNCRTLLRLFSSAGGVSEKFSCSRAIQRCFQNIKEVIDTVKANAFYVRMVKHCFAVFDSIKISRLLKVQLFELCKPIQNLFVSRCIFRLVSEVCGFWERLLGRRGVHRVEVLLYSPITLEIELTGGKNMKKIFTGQSSLRMIVDCNINLIGEVEAKIYAEKPNGITVAFVCFVLDAEKGKIAFDVTDSHTFDVSGLWKLCSHITFNDGRSVQGDPTNMYVFEAMKKGA